MSTSEWIVLAAFGAASVWVLAMLGQLTMLLRPAKHRAVSAVRKTMLSMISTAGVWQVSVAAVLITQHAWDSAVGPAVMGIAMAGARLIVPAVTNRLS